MSIEEEIEQKRRHVLGLEITDEQEVAEDTILLPIAAGVMPSIVASILKKPKKQVQKIVNERKNRLLELTDMVTTEYQEIQLGMMFDDSVTRLREIINDDTANAGSVVTAAKEILRMLKEDDVKRSLSGDLMNSTFEDVVDNVEGMEQKIAEIKARKQKMGL